MAGLWEGYKANGPVPELGEVKVDQKTTGELPGGGAGRLTELGEEFKANGPVPELGEVKADQETTGEPPGGGAGRLAELGKGKELEDKADQETKGVPDDVSVLIEPSGATMDQETEQGERETGGRV